MFDALARVRECLAHHYDVRDVVGRGGMATVYCAEDLRNRRRVAIKVLDPAIAEYVGVDRFEREIEIAANLNHPNIVPLYQSGASDGLLYYVMPLIDGESLADLVDREQQLPIEDVLRITREVGDALTYAHRLGIVHRDIKPSNILLVSGHAMVSDFGLALATAKVRDAVENGVKDPSTPTRMTDPGVAVGTVEYMSPEQAGATGRVDHRSDLYSLSCVVYEMLTGEPPFSGQTSRAVIARHMLEDPPKARVVRPQIPTHIDEALQKGLAKAPADRHRSVEEFIKHLERPAVREPRDNKWRWAGFVGVAAAILIAIFVLTNRPPPAPPLDRMQYLVLPFQHIDGVAPDSLDGPLCARLVRGAIEGLWSDLRVVDQIRLNSALDEFGSDIITVDQAVLLARRLGAGHLIWGDVSELLNGVISVRGSLYDVAANVNIRDHEIQLDPDLNHHGDHFNRLTNVLLTGEDVAADRLTGAVRTASMGAWRMYENGFDSLRQWNLESARLAFDRATELDPSYGQAFLWSSLVSSWIDHEPTSWVFAARQAASNSGGLSDFEFGLARVLVAMADGNLQDACTEFDRLVVADSMDFRGWFGRGQCFDADRAVLPDSTSPSGWVFRSSRHSAMQSYHRAIALAPGIMRAFRGSAYARLSGFVASGNSARRGHSLDSSQMFRAYAGLHGDTISYIPWDAELVRSGDPRTLPPTHNAAVLQTLEDLGQSIEAWVTANSLSSEAHEAHARILESLNQLGATGESRRPATDAANRALELARLREDSVRIENMLVRHYLKLEDWQVARDRSVGLLDRIDDPTPSEAVHLAPLALLLGRAHLAADLLIQRLADEPEIYFPRSENVADLHPLARLAAQLHAYASIGAPRESLVVLGSRLELELSVFGPTSQRQDELREQIDYIIASAAATYPEVVYHGSSAPLIGILRMYRDLARLDTNAVRTQLEQLRRGRAGVRPGDLVTDRAFQEAWLYVQIGDTTGAIAQLDATLNALKTLTPSITTRSDEAAGLMRMMVLRAQLANREGDSRNARRWALPVQLMWQNTDDPELLDISEEMGVILSRH